MKNKIIPFLVAACILIASKLDAQSTITIAYDTLAPVCSVDSLTCSAMITYPFQITADNGQDLVVSHQLIIQDSTEMEDNFGTLNGTYTNFEITGAYPIGTYQFVITISDGIAVDTTFLLPFEVVDCVIPEVDCVSSLNISLFPVQPVTDVDGDGDIDTGAAALWAIDFFQMQAVDCSLPFRYSIGIEGSVPNIDQSLIVVTCEDQSTFLVDVYIWDAAFNPYSIQPDGSIGGPNYKKCVAAIHLNDDLFNTCNFGSPENGLTGIIEKPNGTPIENVQVIVEGPSSFVDTFYTNSNGHFFGNSDGMIGEYTATASLVGEPLNGVTSLDLVLIKRHILNLERLDDPYRLIAADVNYSGSISTQDLIDILQLILGVEANFPSNQVWRFISADYVFQYPFNPWLEGIPEMNQEEYIFGNISIGDFYGVKLGDVNHSAN